MRGKKAKQFRKICRHMSEAWTEYVAVRQRDGYGRPVRPVLAPALLPRLDENGKKIWGPDGKRLAVEVPCIIRTGHEQRLERYCGKGLYRRMKANYKQAKRWGHV